MEVLEIAVGAVFAPTRPRPVSISTRDLVADEKSLVRNLVVEGRGQYRILKNNAIKNSNVNFSGRPLAWGLVFFCMLGVSTAFLVEPHS